MVSNEANSASKRVIFRPCCKIATGFLVVAVASLIVLVALALTVFRPQNPTFTISLVGIPIVRLEDIIATNNVTISVVVGLSNANYASFTWRNFTASVEYKGTPVGEVPIQGGTIFQRSEINVTTSATLRSAAVLWLGPEVVADALEALRVGGLNFTCSKTVFGWIRAFNVLPEIRGSVSIDCFSSMYVNNYFSPANEGVFGGEAWCRAVKKQVINVASK